MPLPKQTQDLIFSLQALIYRLRQLKKERQGYSKSKHRELAKLLKEGREEFARIKTEDVISNDNLIAALEILELHCEQLHVRANILDHLAFGQKSKKKLQTKGRSQHPRNRGDYGTAGRPSHNGDTRSGAAHRDAEKDQGGGWGVWKFFGFSSVGTSQQSIDTVPSRLQDRLSHDNDPTEEQSPVTAATPLSDRPKEEEEEEVYIDPELDRSAAVIFYSYQRIPRDVPGLPEVRNKLAQRWGNDFATRAQDDDDPPVKLPTELVDRLCLRKAPQSLVELYLKEIARAHGIPFGESEDEEDPGEQEVQEEKEEIKGEGQDDDGEGTGGASEEEGREQGENVKKEVAQGSKPARSKPKGKSSGTAAPGTKDLGPSINKLTGTKDFGFGSGGSEDDDLARRFAALKR